MSNEFTVEQLQELIKCAAENKIGEFLYEDEGVKLRIRGPRAAHPVLPVQAEGIALTAPAAVQPQEATPAQEDKPASENNIVSPIVGTFYAAPGPDKEPFVKVGQHIAEGDIVFIIESMKVMNEVPADKSGTVVEILVENGEGVEFGQPILRLE